MDPSIEQRHGRINRLYEEAWTSGAEIARLRAAVRNWKHAAQTVTITAAIATAIGANLDAYLVTVTAAGLCSASVLVAMWIDSRYDEKELQGLVERWWKMRMKAREVLKQSEEGCKESIGPKAKELDNEMDDTRLQSIGYLQQPSTRHAMPEEQGLKP